MRVMLVVPPNTIKEDSTRRIGEPLGILYLAAVLEKEGHPPDVFDCTLEGYHHTVKMDDGYITYGSSNEEILARIRKYKPDVVGIGCMFSGREKNTLMVAKLIKEVNPDIKIIIGGIHAAIYPKRLLSLSCVDYIVTGEGEIRLPQLIEAMEENREPDIDGVGYRNRKGKIVITPAVRRIEDLDSIPFPARHLVDFEGYIKIGIPYTPFTKRERVAQILTSRGCPYKCNFCSSVNYWGRKFRVRSVDNVIQEIDELVTKYKIQEIQFTDDNLTIDSKRAKELFSRMMDYDLAWCTPNGLNVNHIDGEMIDLMARSGAYQLSIAVESGSQEMLNNVIHKPIDLNKVKPIVDRAHRNGVSIHGKFIVGFPGETKEQILQTLDFPWRIGFESVSFFIATPLPGSDLYDECERKGYLATEQDFEKMDFKTVNIHIPKDSKDYTIDPKELMDLVDKKTREYNEWSKKKYPEKWKQKFKLYLEKHPERADMIFGRVT